MAEYYKLIKQKIMTLEYKLNTAIILKDSVEEQYRLCVELAKLHALKEGDPRIPSKIKVGSKKQIDPTEIIKNSGKYVVSIDDIGNLGNLKLNYAVKRRGDYTRVEGSFEAKVVVESRDVPISIMQVTVVNNVNRILNEIYESKDVYGYKPKGSLDKLRARITYGGVKLYTIRALKDNVRASHYGYALVYLDSEKGSNESIDVLLHTGNMELMNFDINKSRNDTAREIENELIRHFQNASN